MKRRRFNPNDNATVSVDHYENFPVASVLCPPALRAPIVAIYGFARTADDIADEGDASSDQRLRDLARFRAALHAAVAGRIDDRWPQVFGPLKAAIERHRLNVDLLEDLLSAFEQDVVQHRYDTRAELLDYCRRSANPVGRLLLQLNGVSDAASLERSDAICSALQLINFWQDLRVDTSRGRIYLPASDLQQHGVSPDALLRHQDTPATRALVLEVAAWARSMMHTGEPLVHALPGRAGWELRLVVQGGLRILDKIDHLQGATLTTRPRLRPVDGASMLWRACRMTRSARPVAVEPA